MPCRHLLSRFASRRCFSASFRPRTVHGIQELPDRIFPAYKQSQRNDLLCLEWPAPPRNILITKKNNTRETTEALIELAKHVHSTYPTVSVILEPAAADEVHEALPFPVYTDPAIRKDAAGSLHRKVDLIATLGGDGTILHASALFAAERVVPPILSFSMGTLGFLGEWKFHEHKRAFREVYMSGASDGYGSSLQSGHSVAAHSDAQSGRGAEPPTQETSSSGWSSIRGKSMGSGRGARVLLRTRLKVGVFRPDGEPISFGTGSDSNQSVLHAMNEVIIHRGRDPHLAIVDVFVGGRFLTEAVADGMIVSTPTGSTAYSLSSGGSIVHPLVSSLLLTPICPRSLSFRPLVLPANTPITLKLSEKNRAREVEVSIDGARRSHGLGVGAEIRVCGEEIRDELGNWVGGVPSIVRGAVGGETSGEDQWVGGLNSLLKFNYPFGETPV